MNDITLAGSKKAKINLKCFGEAEQVLDGRTIFDYGYCPMLGEWYEYPFDIVAVSKLFRATSHHSSSIIAKRNILATAYKEHPLLSRQQFKTLVFNYQTFTNAYLHVTRNRLGGILSLTSRPAIHMRKGIKQGHFFQLMFGQYSQLSNGSFQQTEFLPNEIIHIYDIDIDQEIYGVPDYLSAVNSILLNEAATLFRRRYYKNGAHAGFILHLSDALQTQDDIDELEQALEDSKGAGNFKNLMIYTPDGQKDGVKVIPLAEVAAKDEFMNIKIASRDDQLASHRMPPQLIGVVPQNVGGFGDIEKAARVFYAHEIMPIQKLFEDLNKQLGVNVFTFEPFEMLKQYIIASGGA